MNAPKESLADRIRHVRERAAAACRKAGRKPDDVTIIYVSKTVSCERILEALACGCLDFGENRPQELQEKSEQLHEEQERLGLRWHMIGHLQTNKVKQVLGKTVLIHSLDRMDLAETIERQAAAKSIPRVDCLIQINGSAESTKFGLNPEEAEKFAAWLTGGVIRIRGLMTIGPLTEDPEKIRQCFKRVRLLRDDLKRKFPAHDWETLSMGMSGDFETAIEEGSTMIRVGTAVFGERKNSV